MYLCKDGKPITIYDFQSFSRIYRLMKLDYPAAWYYGLFSTLLHSYLHPRELPVWQVEQAFVDWTAKLYNDPEYVAERMESLFREDMEYREWRAELLGPEVRDRYNDFLNFLRVERDDLWGHQVPLLGESKWSEVE